MIKKILLSLGFVLTFVVMYYMMVILDAREITPNMVHQALTSDRMKLNWSDLSKAQWEALIKVQDPNFYTHHGVDFSTRGAGVTTISQSLVKRYYFEDFKPGFQKAEQTLLSVFAFDPLTPKDTILKLFINEVYLGEDQGQEIKGFEHASWFYMGKSFHALTWDEYLALVAMIRAPSRFNYKNNRVANGERVLRIKKMLSGAYVPKDHGDWLYGQE